MDHTVLKVKLLSSRPTSLKLGVMRPLTLPTEESHTIPLFFKPVDHMVPKEKLPLSKPTSLRPGVMKLLTPLTKEFHTIQLFSKPADHMAPKVKLLSLKLTSLRPGVTKLSTLPTEESHITPLSSNSATKIWLIFLMMRIQRKSSSAKTKSSQETSSSLPSRVKKREMNSSRSRISRASHLISSSCKATNQRWKPWRTTPSVSHSTSDSLMYQLSTEMSSKWKRSE